MSSSNRVRLAVIPETVYGETPAVGDFQEARFISESLSGTPETTESQQIRSDRLSSGQVVTGLTVGGAINFELAKEAMIDSFIESAMFNTWQTSLAVNQDMVIDTLAKTIERATGDWVTDVAVGDIITLSGFLNTENNTQVMVLELVDTVTIRYVGKGLVDELGAGTSFKKADKIDIGTTKKSFSIEKVFQDLSNKAIIYKGEVVSEMSMNIAYGEIVNGAFTFAGNYAQPVDNALDFITNGRTVTPAETSNSLNGSVDMPFIVTQDGAVLDEATFCIQSIELTLNNNLRAQTCIGSAAPKNQTEGAAQIEISMSAYLADANWDMLTKKLSQEPISIGFMVKNLDGYYGFYLPAIQLSFEDPASGGQNQDVILSMSGTAKVGSNQEKSLTMYKS